MVEPYMRLTMYVRMKPLELQCLSMETEESVGHNLSMMVLGIPLGIESLRIDTLINNIELYLNTIMVDPGICKDEKYGKYWWNFKEISDAAGNWYDISMEKSIMLNFCWFSPIFQDFPRFFNVEVNQQSNPKNFHT